MSLEDEEITAGWLVQIVIDWVVQSWHRSPASGSLWFGDNESWVLSTRVEEIFVGVDEDEPLWDLFEEENHHVVAALVDIYGDRPIRLAVGRSFTDYYFDRPLQRGLPGLHTASQFDTIFFKSEEAGRAELVLATETIRGMRLGFDVADGAMASVSNMWEQFIQEKRR